MQAYEGKGNEANTQERGDSIMFEKIDAFLEKNCVWLVLCAISYILSR